MERNHICKVDLRACVVRSYSVMISTKLLCSSANIISSMYSTTCIVMITVSFKLTMMTGLLKCLALPPSEIFPPPANLYSDLKQEMCRLTWIMNTHGKRSRSQYHIELSTWTMNTRGNKIKV